MREAGCDRHFSRERIARNSIIHEARPEDLDGDIGAGASVSRPIHLVAPATAEPLDDHEVLVERRARLQPVFQPTKSKRNPYPYRSTR